MMFPTETPAGQIAGSQTLMADALDFVGDAVTYGVSLAVIGPSLRTRATAALAKNVSLLLMARAYINGHDHDLQHIVVDDVHYLTCGAGCEFRGTGEFEGTRLQKPPSSSSPPA